MKRLRELWYRLLVLLHLKPDFRNPDVCPPAFQTSGPHPFKRFEGSLVCGECGGGRLHEIHQVKP